MVIDGWQELPGRLLCRPVLYNDLAYLRLKDLFALKTLIAVNEHRDVLSRLRLAKEHSTAAWTSLPGAPFGGIERSPGDDIGAFLRFVKTQFDPGEKLMIKCPPGIYGNGLTELTEAGFELLSTELNHHVALTAPLAIHPMQERRLNKARKAKCAFEKWPLDGDHAQQLHRFISDCRQAQGLQVNISCEDFRRATEQLPSAYMGYAVQLDGQLIAATVVVRVTDRIAYNYLPASDRAYHHLSPMVLLMVHVYEELSRQGFGIMDWGITSISGEEQVSLARFKEAMGAQRGEKGYLGITL